ncbi:hypothetical protein D3C72_1621900 [compost metagenome]
MRERLRGVGVVRLQGLENGQVLGAGFVDAAGPRQAAMAGQAEHLAQVAHHIGQPLVAGQGLDGFVDEVVGLVVRVDTACPGMVRQRGVQRLQRGQLPVAGLARGLIGAAPFQHGHQREDVFQVLQRQFVDEAAPPGFQPHQPFRGKHLERLAQGGAGNAHFARQPQFVDPFAVAQRTRVDHAAQAVRDFQVQGLPDDGVGHGLTAGLRRNS